MIAPFHIIMETRNHKDLAILVLVPDVYAAAERFEKLGVKFVKPDDGKMKGLAFIEDPDGYWIEILQANMIEKIHLK